MEINPKIFKAYDIRGVYKQDFDDDFAYQLGLAFGQFRQKETEKESISVVVAGDMRISTPQIKEKLIQGLIDKGVEVIDVDLVSTPTFYFAVSLLQSDGGIIVSASHNPKEWNGFKLVRNKAKPISGDDGINKLKEKILNRETLPKEEKGSLKKIDNILQKQIDHDLNFFEPNKIKPLKVVVDTANGMGSQYIESLFKYLSCQLIKMNFELDGTFPAHEADPIKKENLIDIKKKIIAEKADLGIAIDGDGDRVFFIDNNGEAIDQSIIRAILSKLLLQEKPGSKICYDIRPGRITPETIEKNGGIPIVTQVGHSLIKKRAIEENAYFAGESSGHFFLNTEMGCFEVPVIIIGKLLQEFSRSNQKISDYIKPYQKYYHSGEINFSVKDKQNVFSAIEKTYGSEKIIKIDGITVETEKFWFNIRGSNTEEKVRLNLEATSQEIMEEKTKEISHIIKNS